VANVMNYVQNSTTASAEGVNYIKSSVELDKCTIILKGDFNVDNYAQVSQTSTQIITAVQDTNIQNDIQQKMLQEATSKVGSLGIGFADASNTASMLCNVTNQIINTMAASIQNFTYSQNSFTCTDSYIKANNLNISQTTTTNFVSDQTLNNSQTTDIINTVSQSIEQKASATVQGIAGFLIALALLIAAVGYALSKPIGSASKSIMIPMILVVIVLVVVWLYLVKAPPFFADYIIVSPYVPTFGGCENTGVVQVKKQTITLKNSPPLKYNFPIMSGNSPSDRGYLINMVISKTSSGGTTMNAYNCGYNYSTYTRFAADDDPTKWNVDTQGLYKKIFGDTPESQQYRLPNLLMLPKCGDKYPVLPQWFVDACNPVCVSFSDTASGCNTTTQLLHALQQLRTNELVASGALQDSPPACDLRSDAKPEDLRECCKKQTSFSLQDWVGTSSGDTYTTQDHLDEKSNVVICPLNESGWRKYLTTGTQEIQQKKQLYARFWLSLALGIDCNFYIMKDEPVAYTDDNGVLQIVLASDNLDRCYQFTQFASVASYGDAITSGGNVVGMFGYCNNNSYKFKKFMKNVGSWIVILFILLICVLIGLKGTRFFLPNSNAPKTTKTQHHPTHPQQKKK